MNPENFTILTDEAFQEYVRNHNKFTLEILEGESETPHLLVVTRNTETMKDELTVCCLAVNFNETKEKQEIMFGMGAKFYEEKQIVLAVVLSSECWTSKRGHNEDWQNVQPRHDPRRQEGILVAGAGIDPKQRMVIITPVKRDDKNNMVIDGKSVEMPKDVKFFLADHFWRGYFAKVKGMKYAPDKNTTGLDGGRVRNTGL